MHNYNSRQSRLGIFVLFAVLLLVPLPARSDEGGDPQQVLLEIGQEKFTLGDFLLHLRQINPLMDFAKLPPSEQRHWVDEYVAQKLFARRAREARLDETPEVRARLEFFADRVLAQAFHEQMRREVTVSEEEVAHYYDRHAEEFRRPARVLLQHFLYRSPERAALAQARLRGGAPFAELAEEKRSDPDVLLAERGWFHREQLLPPLAEPAFALPPGGVSEVIATGYGYHVIRAEILEPSRLPERVAVQADIEQRLRQVKAGERAREILGELKARPR